MTQDARPDGPADEMPPMSAGDGDAGGGSNDSRDADAAGEASAPSGLTNAAAPENEGPGQGTAEGPGESRGESTAEGPEEVALPYAPPRTAGPAGPLGVLFSLVVLAAGVVLIHDALVFLNVVSGSDWITTAADGIGTVRPSSIVLWIGIAAAALGLILIIAAVFPRRVYGMRLVGEGGLYVREQDVARLSSSAAQGTGVVREASSTASRRRVVVRARTTIDRDAVEIASESVVQRLAIMRNPPTVVVRAKGRRT